MTLVPRKRRLEVRLQSLEPTSEGPPSLESLVNRHLGLHHLATGTRLSMRCTDARDDHVTLEAQDQGSVRWVMGLQPGEGISLTIGSQERLWVTEATVVCTAVNGLGVVAQCGWPPRAVEQRRYPRVVRAVPVTIVRLTPLHQAFETVTHDISLGGIAVVSEPGLVVGEQVAAILRLKEQALALATVMGISDIAPRARLMFEKMTMTSQDRVAAAVNNAARARSGPSGHSPLLEPVHPATTCPRTADHVVTLITPSDTTVSWVVARRLSVGSASLEVGQRADLAAGTEVMIHLEQPEGNVCLLARVVRDVDGSVDVVFVNSSPSEVHAVAAYVTRHQPPAPDGGT